MDEYENMKEFGGYAVKTDEATNGPTVDHPDVTCYMSHAVKLVDLLICELAGSPDCPIKGQEPTVYMNILMQLMRVLPAHIQNDGQDLSLEARIELIDEICEKSKLMVFAEHSSKKTTHTKQGTA